MTFLYWLVIISAAVLVLSFFMGRAPARRPVPVPPDDRPDAVHIKENHGAELAAEVSPPAPRGPWEPPDTVTPDAGTRGGGAGGPETRRP